MSINGSCKDGAMDDSWVVMWHGWFRLQNIVEEYYPAKPLDQTI